METTCITIEIALLWFLWHSPLGIWTLSFATWWRYNTNWTIRWLAADNVNCCN